MSNLRQKLETLSRDYPNGGGIPEHAHAHAQLIYVAKGVVTVKTHAGIWVIPPERAVWIPPRIPHALEFARRSQFRTLYLRVARRKAAGAFALNISPLLRELILAACSVRGPRRDNEAMLALVKSEIASCLQLPLYLPEPRDALLAKFCHGYLNGRSKKIASDAAGVSSRTVDRLFQKDLRMSFSDWKRRALILEALQHLAGGASVARTAARLGYSSPSAFVHMFRQVLGRTPGKYFAATAQSKERTR